MAIRCNGSLVAVTMLNISGATGSAKALSTFTLRFSGIPVGSVNKAADSGATGS
jgi:hypothetical protein